MQIITIDSDSHLEKELSNHNDRILQYKENYIFSHATEKTSAIINHFFSLGLSNKFFLFNNSPEHTKKIQKEFYQEFIIWDILYSPRILNFFTNNDNSYSIEKKVILDEQEKLTLTKKWKEHYLNIFLKDSSPRYQEMMSTLHTRMLQDSNHILIKKNNSILAHFYLKNTPDAIWDKKVIAVHKWVDIELPGIIRKHIHYIFQQLLQEKTLPFHASIAAENTRSYLHFLKYGFNHTFTGVFKID